jgi:hypothetical protein
VDVNRRWMYKGTYVLDESVAVVLRIENNGRYSRFLQHIGTSQHWLITQ